ncbi:hypothetical protein BSY47_004712 [Salmonella enterica subsp. enterica serovar Adelaide]|nr:hypothetical protein [Salmonella enterica subsp. enterica serovar Adelaide]
MSAFFLKLTTPLTTHCDEQGRTTTNRVGGGITPAVLSHHRTCGSAYGGSC